MPAADNEAVSASRYKGATVVLVTTAARDPEICAPINALFDNKDDKTNHDVDILDAAGTKVYDMKDFPGPAVKTFDVPALKAGTYKFECSIHPALMNGQLTVGG